MGRKKRTAVQSVNKKEFDRLRKNILAKMRYREKQGFKVDYATRPKAMSNPTKRDIQRLAKTEVGLNIYGEIQAIRPTRGVRVTQPTREQVRTSKQILAERNNGDNRTPEYYNRRSNVEVSLDYVGMIYGALTVIRDKSQQYSTGEIGGSWRADEYAAAWMAIFDTGCETVDEQVARYGEDVVNIYYGSRFEEISRAINDIITWWDSDPEELAIQGMSAVKKLLIVSPNWSEIRENIR